jgi:hypothetical protein
LPVLCNGNLFTLQKLFENSRELILEVIDTDRTVSIGHAHEFRLDSARISSRQIGAPALYL